MLGSIKILEHAFVRSIALKLSEQQAFKDWIGTVPRHEAVCGIVVGAMMEFFLVRPADGRDFVKYTDAAVLDALSGVPGFSRALWLSGIFMKVEVPAEGVAVERLNAWFGPDAHRLITAMLYLYGREPVVVVSDSFAAAMAAEPSRNGHARPKPKERLSGFEEFWAAYPRKEGGKKQVRESYDKAVMGSAKEKIAPVSHGQIMAGLAKAMKSPQWLKDEGKFIPYPATWLNQGRWDDEPEVKLEGAKPDADEKARVQREKVRRENERRERIKKGLHGEGEG